MALSNNTICCANAGLMLDALHCTAGDVTGPCRQLHWGETGLANAGVSLSKMDAPKVGKSVFCSFEVFHHTFRASHSPTVFI